MTNVQNSVVFSSKFEFDKYSISALQNAELHWLPLFRTFRVHVHCLKKRQLSWQKETLILIFVLVFRGI